MDNPIKFADLFDNDVVSGIADLKKQVNGFKKDLEEVAQQLKSAGSGIVSSLSEASSATKEGRETTKAQSAEVDKLYDTYKKLEEAIKKCEDRLKKMSETGAGAGPKHKKNNDALLTSYASLNNLLNQTKVNLDQLITSEKARNQVAKNGQVANNALGGSYEQLYAQYNLIKIALNNMTDGMRNAEQVGKVWEAEALRIMNAMKQMQSATGKNTLNVGNYQAAIEASAKSLNGLQISTQQVLREMPTLANSLQQFFIAISNNVPIFVDNLKRVQKETGSWAIAMRGVFTSLLSWQTLLLVVLTILPRLAKAIHDKRKAMQEDNKTTKETISLLGLLRDAMLAVQKAQVEDAAKLRTLTSIIADHNRTEEERIQAAQALKNIYGEQLENYTAEEIALGKAKTALDNITESIKKQAQARALLNKITEAYSKQIEAEDAARRMEIDLGKDLVFTYRSFMATVNIKDEEKRAKRLRELRKSLTDEQWEQVRTYANLKKESKTYLEEIDRLTKMISVAGLLGLDDKGGKATKAAKATIDKIKDYYLDYVESVAELEKDDETREKWLLSISIARKQQQLEATIEELREEGKLTKENEKYLNREIINLDILRERELDRITAEYEEKRAKNIQNLYKDAYKQAIEDIKNEYTPAIVDATKKELEARKKYNKAIEDNSYRLAKKEGQAYKEATIAKINEEARLQRAILEFRNQTGELSDEQYQLELAKIEKHVSDTINNLQSKRKGKRTNLWSMIFGITGGDSKGNAWKELDQEQNQFISTFNSALNTSMQYMNEWMSKRIEMAQIAVDAAHQESESAKTALDREMEARANGYANNVQLARKEYEERLALERKAIEEKKRLEKIQEAVNSAQQASSLITATANLWASYSSIPGFGLAMAIAATTAMWGSFAASKIMAAQATKAKTYGEGGMEYIDYGGSHASGHDVDFGRTKDGRPRRIERGEAVAVINKRNVNKYGIDTIGNIVSALNHGTFESQFGSVVDSTKGMDMAAMYELAFSSLGLGGSTDLSAVERGIQTLVEQGSVRVVPTPYGRIEYRGNNKRIIRNS